MYIDSVWLADEPAQYVRYAKSMTVYIEMRPGSSGRIYAPYLEIDYDMVSHSNMTDMSAAVCCNFVFVIDFACNFLLKSFR